MTDPFTLIRGDGPLVVSVPHASAFVPDAIAARLNDTGRVLADADWHVDELVAPLAGPASLIIADFHRYVIDANRDPAGTSLYPGQATTELVPTTDFDGRPLWREGAGPTGSDIAARLHDYHLPYHDALAEELERQKAAHGVAVLFDVHSIRSVVPRLFEGTLAPFNIGTDGGRTCGPAFERAAVEVCEAAGETVLNGRFRGGWTVRQHGRPQENIHAVQLEMAQRQYMDEAPPFARHAGARPLMETLHRLAERLAEVARQTAAA